MRQPPSERRSTKVTGPRWAAVREATSRSKHQVAVAYAALALLADVQVLEPQPGVGGLAARHEPELAVMRHDRVEPLDPPGLLRRVVGRGVTWHEERRGEVEVVRVPGQRPGRERGSRRLQAWLRPHEVGEFHLGGDRRERRPRGAPGLAREQVAGARGVAAPERGHAQPVVADRALGSRLVGPRAGELGFLDEALEHQQAIQIGAVLDQRHARVDRREHAGGLGRAARPPQRHVEPVADGHDRVVVLRPPEAFPVRRLRLREIAREVMRQAEVVVDVELRVRHRDAGPVRRAVRLDLERLAADQLGRLLEVRDGAGELTDRDVAVSAVAVEAVRGWEPGEAVGVDRDRLAVAAGVGRAAAQPDAVLLGHGGVEACPCLLELLQDLGRGRGGGQRAAEQRDGFVRFVRGRRRALSRERGGCDREGHGGEGDHTSRDADHAGLSLRHAAGAPSNRRHSTSRLIGGGSCTNVEPVRRTAWLAVVILGAVAAGCGQSVPAPRTIELGRSTCAKCRSVITSLDAAAQAAGADGTARLYDDLGCMATDPVAVAERRPSSTCRWPAARAGPASKT